VRARVGRRLGDVAELAGFEEIGVHTRPFSFSAKFSFFEPFQAT
jgi:hypothetical protein